MNADERRYKRVLLLSAFICIHLRFQAEECSAPAAQLNPDAVFHAAPKPLPAGAVTSDWASFLGPAHNMRSPETMLLRQFAPGEPKSVWEMKKGEGYAAPAIAGERLILFHRLRDQVHVDCLNALDGRRYWRFSYATDYRDRYSYNGGPRCSPVVTDELVFTFGVEGRLHCLDLKTGQLRWQKDILKEFKLEPNFFGVGATPLAEGDKLIVNVGAGGGPCVAAFETRTGKLLWGAGSAWGPSYSTPVPAVLNGKRRVLVFAGGESDPPVGGLLCLDPGNGNIEGEFSWRGKRYESVNACPPVVIDNQVFISECYGAGGALVSVGAEGGCAAVWTNRRFGSHFMTPLAQDGFLYAATGHDGDALVCVDIKDGREVWRSKPQWQETLETPEGEKRTLTFGTARCSLLWAGGRCLCLGEFGHLLWLDLSPQGYRELSRARLFAARETWTAPVLSRGLLYVCQNARDPFTGSQPRLLCYDLRGSE
ncbi:MAG: PQQ-binding-like beta-propeller repeat protein [Planctomycetota bacterium]